MRHVLLVMLLAITCLPAAALAQLSACWDDGECTMTTREDCCGCFCEGLTCDDPRCFCLFLPDPFPSSVQPWDDFGQVFVSPGTQSNIDEVTIRVLQTDGDPYPCANVGIFSDCSDLCVDPEENLTFVGETDVDGYLTVNLQVGGCADCDIYVRVDGVSIGYYPRIVSTDWDGAEADGRVSAADFAFFTTAFKHTQDYFADYNGDGVVSGTDFAMFSVSFKAGDENGQGCR